MSSTGFAGYHVRVLATPLLSICLHSVRHHTQFSTIIAFAPHRAFGSRSHRQRIRRSGAHLYLLQYRKAILGRRQCEFSVCHIVEAAPNCTTTNGTACDLRTTRLDRDETRRDEDTSEQSIIFILYYSWGTTSSAAQILKSKVWLKLFISTPCRIKHRWLGSFCSCVFLNASGYAIASRAELAF